MPEKKLNTHNPEAITFNCEYLNITVLGGIRIEGLDRMRATVKIEAGQKAIRHNLDLYNDLQVEKYTRRAAEKLETGTSFINKTLGELTSLLEEYRLGQIEQAQAREEKKKILSAEEIKAAEQFLKSPYLLEKTNEMIGKSGMIGEEANRLLMYLIYTSRKREHPLHIISLGSSGTGKTYLQEKTSELIPEEDKTEITTLSDNAFYYFGQRELKNKLILIEDLDGAENVLYPLRELQSKKKISKTVAHKDSRGNTKTVHLTVEGPVSVAGCTTREKIYEDNANRSFLIYLDESPEQDEKIMEYQRKVSAGLIDTEAEEEIKELMKNCQRILKPVTIKNPYAPLLKIPQEVFKPRRTNSHYLQFIEAITFYHQYQREQQTDKNTGEIFIETTLEDIAAANQLMKEILLRKSDQLSGACRNYFEELKDYLREKQQTKFTNKEIRAKLRIPHSTVKRYHLELASCGLIQVAKNKNQKYKGYWYEIISTEEYRELQNKIGSVLDQILQQLIEKENNGPVLSDAKGLTGSKTAHHTTEPPKAVKNNNPPTAAQQPTETSKQVKKTTPGLPTREALRETYQCLKKAAGKDINRYFTVRETVQLTGKSRRTENKYLKELYEAGWLIRKHKDKGYIYKVKTSNQ